MPRRDPPLNAYLLAARPDQTLTWRPIATAAKKEGIEVLLWHGRANVGGWHDKWDLDHRMPNAAIEGGWVINGGYVVRPTLWMPIPPVND